MSLSHFSGHSSHAVHVIRGEGERQCSSLEEQGDDSIVRLSPLGLPLSFCLSCYNHNGQIVFSLNTNDFDFISDFIYY